jgi:hypothetical protein
VPYLRALMEDAAVWLAEPCAEQVLDVSQVKRGLRDISPARRITSDDELS